MERHLSAQAPAEEATRVRRGLRRAVSFLSRRSHGWIVRVHLRLLGLLFQHRAVPLSYWICARLLIGLVFRRPDTLSLPLEALQSTGVSLQAAELRHLLLHEQLGAWALDRGSLDLLWQKIWQDRPRVIIECGAGVSSMMLAQYAALSAPKETECSVILSVEQDARAKALVEDRLAAHGLGRYLRIVHAPLSHESAYDFDSGALEELLGGRKADWLLIDGPAGPPECRRTTLPLLARFSRPRTRWFLHDALRDGELGVLREWSRWAGVVVEGIYPTGKGLATGVVKDPQILAEL